MKNNISIYKGLNTETETEIQKFDGLYYNL